MWVWLAKENNLNQAMLRPFYLMLINHSTRLNEICIRDLLAGTPQRVGGWRWALFGSTARMIWAWRWDVIRYVYIAARDIRHTGSDLINTGSDDMPRVYTSFQTYHVTHVYIVGCHGSSATWTSNSQISVKSSLTCYSWQERHWRFSIYL